MPHEDGLLYYPTVTTISIGSQISLDFYKTLKQNETESNLDERYTFSLILEPRSLLILQEDMYKCYLHGIKEIKEDTIDSNLVKNFDRLNQNIYQNNCVIQRETRTSLTIRHVPKIYKLSANSLLSKLIKKP
jgi:alkylated DNA repair protein alkB family protein 6